MNLQIIIPILSVVIIFLLLNRTPLRKLFNNPLFVQIRILLGCAAMGYLLHYAIINSNTRSIIMSALLVGIVLFNSYKLHQKYFLPRQ